LNLACGFVAVILAYQGKFYASCMIMILGSIFDMVDGRIARLTGTQSSFGEQFDSMSDVISFGVAPSLIMYFYFLKDIGRIGIIAPLLYLLCGALRLARFNANVEKVHPNYFQGLPIPGAAIAIVGLVLISLELKGFLNFNPYFAAGYLIFYGILMISNLPFCSFKKSDWVRAHRKRTLFFIFMIIAATCIYESFMIPLVITLYVLISIVYFIFKRGELNNVFDWNNE
jgi:CDP-diacylglycerol--serine O-phosphatidyltransferase